MRNSARPIGDRRLFWFVLAAAFCLPAAIETTPATDDSYPINYVAGSLIRLNDNGAWSWFMDPRVIVDDGKLIVGSVRAVGAEAANTSDPRWGNVEIAMYDIRTGTLSRRLHEACGGAARVLARIGTSQSARVGPCVVP